MIKLKSLLLEAIQFTNWKIPSVQSLKREFEVEHEKKGHDFFNSEKKAGFAVPPIADRWGGIPGWLSLWDLPGLEFPFP